MGGGMRNGRAQPVRGPMLNNGMPPQQGGPPMHKPGGRGRR